jgi:hypothetical protein
MVHPGKDPFDDGCVLVYASDRNKAKSLGFKKGPWIEFDYLDFRAVRKPVYDNLFKASGKYLIETNDELPEGAPPFFTDYHIGC